MANGYFERGEVYWVRMDNGFGGEQGVGRPGLIVSNNEENVRNDTVTIAFLTTKFYPNKQRAQIDATGTTSYVIHNQMMTYDKSRLGKYLGVLNRVEQKDVDDRLEGYLDLGYKDDEALKEKEREIAARDALIVEKDAEIEALKKQLNASKYDRDQAETAYKVENAMWQKLYERSLDQLVKMKLNADVALRMQRKGSPVAEPQVVKPVVVVESPKVEEAPKVEEPETQGLVDINHCTITELKKIGFSVGLARAVVAARPFKSVEDLKRVSGMAKTRYRIVEPKVCCTPLEIIVVEEPVSEIEEKQEVTLDDKSTLVAPVVEIPEEKPKKEKVVWNGVKVNVNKVETAAEIHRRTGLTLRTAQEIMKHREQFGDYEKVEDLLFLKNFGNTCMKRYGHMLEV